MVCALQLRIHGYTSPCFGSAIVHVLTLMAVILNAFAIFCCGLSVDDGLVLVPSVFGFLRVYGEGDFAV